MKALFATLLLLLVPTLAAADVYTAFPKGTFTLHTYAAYTDDVESADYAIPSVNVGAGWYVWDSFAIGAEASVLGFYSGNGDDTEAFSLGVFLRHHFVETKNYTIFFDALFAPTYADSPTPGDGTHFNFITRLGFGTTVPIAEKLDFIGGVRFFHLSNANMHGRDENPAINGVQGYAGLMWRW